MKSGTVILAAWLAGTAFGAPATTAEVPPVIPLPRAHAHNDYEHARPLLDALDRGFGSVEADIYLVDGQLLVAHERNQVSPERTLESLYLGPLRQRVATHGGQVYPGGPPLLLLIDLKTDADKTYAVLRELLRQYADLLTEFGPDRTQPRAVTVILSGNRPRDLLRAEPVRYAAMDGRLPDLLGPESRHLIPLVSDQWRTIFQWSGTGPAPEKEKAVLRQKVQEAHRQGRLFRLWGAPDRREVWQVFYEAGVDLLNADDLDGLRQFLLQQPAQ